MRVTIEGARVIDPASNLDTLTDLHLDEGRFGGVSTLKARFIHDRRLNARRRSITQVHGGRSRCELLRNRHPHLRLHDLTRWLYLRRRGCPIGELDHRATARRTEGRLLAEWLSTMMTT